MNKLFTAATVCLCLALSTTVLPAQQQARTDAFVLGVSTGALPNGVLALVVRTANYAQPDLIVLAPDANAKHTLRGALAMLQKLRDQQPTSSQTQVMSISYAEAKHDMAAERRGRFEAALRSARDGETRVIAGVGKVHVSLINPATLK